MGIAWTGPVATPPAPPPKPSPAPPPACTKYCGMVPFPETRKDTSQFYRGVFGDAKQLDLAACKAACVKDVGCVQLTYGPGTNRCVFYSSIYNALVTVPGAFGFVKCAVTAAAGGNGESAPNPAKCAPLGPPTPPSDGNRCFVYHAIDMSIPSTAHPGTHQWLLHGRQNPVQHDWIPQAAAGVEEAAVGGTESSTARVRFTMLTDVPYGGAVKLVASWTNATVARVATHVRIRIPEWTAAASVPVSVNGQVDGTGTPGTFYSVNHRKWHNGDVVTFALPAKPRLLQYTGMDQIAGKAGKRYALKIGPVVMPCVGTLDGDNAVEIPYPASADPSTWLVKVNGSSSPGLTYEVKGATAGGRALFKPFWDLNGTDTFTTFPLFQ